MPAQFRIAPSVARFIVVFLVLASSVWTRAAAPPQAGQKVDPILRSLLSGPYSFVYGGKPSQALLRGWQRTEASTSLPGNRQRRRVTYRDPASGLEITEESTLYPELGAVDWVVRLRNAGPADTPILEDLRALDLAFTPPGEGDITLHQASGSAATHLAEDFSLDNGVLPGSAFKLVHYEMQGDKHVGGQLPFFDLQWPEGGLIVAVGWTGQWEVALRRDAGRKLTLQAGQQGVHLKLHPGESIRTPSMLLMPWNGPDRVAAHNRLRQLLVSYYLPRLHGQVALPPVAASTAYVLLFDSIIKKTGKNPLDVLPNLTPQELNDAHGLSSPRDGLNAVNEQNQLDYIRKLPPVGIEAYWMDAGWFIGAWPNGVGNWDPDPAKFPHGLKPIGDAAHQHGLKFLLWFEPERVGPDTAIARQHPEWVLHTARSGPSGGRFNFGIPAARQWMTHLLSQRIDAWGIDIYRNDNNICPLPFWQAADTPDRRGITENHDIEGLYALWDGLLAGHPNLEIDNANWRITGPDIEAMKRSVGSLTRSEICGAGIPHPMSDQLETAELSLWVPLDGNLLHGFSPYSFRSTATTGVAFGLDLTSDYIPRDDLAKAVAEIKELRPYWLGDYYPLAPINFDDQTWCAWQFHRPDLKAGYALFFRRPKSSASSFEAALQGLDPAGRYEVTWAETFDVKAKRVMTGADLARLTVEIPSAPGVMLVRYRSVAP